MLFPNVESHSHALHATLAEHNAKRLAVGTPTDTWEVDERCEYESRILQGHYLEELRVSIQSLVPQHKGTAENFVSWFESLANKGPGQNHMLFDWLADHATAEQMKWFLTQEVAATTNFADLVACSQMSLPAQAKLECARNFWDEMGRGKQGNMHGPLLDRMVKSLGLKTSIATTVWESLALSNTMIGLATTRRYAYHSLGALGVTELTSSHRALKIARGMKRLGMDQWSRSYYDLHAALDTSHARSWISEVIMPLVTLNPDCARFLAEGALMRLRCNQLCFDRYSEELGLANDLDMDFPIPEPFMKEKVFMESLRF